MTLSQFAFRFLLIHVAVIVAAIFSGCEAANQDFAEVFRTNVPTPAEAGQWMIDPNDAEKRRQGILLISNAPWGDADVYMQVYRAVAGDSNEDPMVRAAAVHALGMHGTGSDVQLIVPMLDADQNPKLTRWEAAQALQRLHDPTAVLPMIQALQNDEEPDVRMAIATALGQYPDKRVLEALIAALNDRSLGVNRNALRSLKILTGEDFRYEVEDWVSWSRSADDPFVNGRAYTYPVYTRELSWIERYTPFKPEDFEKPGAPRGIEPEAERDEAEDDRTFSDTPTDGQTPGEPGEASEL